MMSEYKYDKESFEVTDQMLADFDKYGYIIIRGLLEKQEVARIKEAVEREDGVTQYAYGINDDEEKKTRLVIWNQPGDDVTGMVARCEKVATTTEKLLRGEIYHFHTKLMMKQSTVKDGKREAGGRHIWHQDYGYWYKNDFLFTDMLTVFMPVDPCNRGNGCLQVIPGSHKCGRIDHVMIGGQTGADLTRVQQLLDYGLDLAYVEMEPGDALFFHCNLLHKSEQNNTDQRRWAFLVAYNRVDNVAVTEPYKSQYRPLVKVPNSAIMECTQIVNLEGKEFLDPKKDRTIVYEEEENKEKK